MKSRYQFNKERLAIIKENYNKDLLLKKQLLELKEKLDKSLGELKYSVTDKEMIPESQDKHDYFSIGIYAWPNKNTENGLPWILDDCKANPYVKTMASDSIRIERFCNDIMILTTLYYVFEDKKYVNKIENMLEIWFINEDTKMNPNMNYAQAIPGVCSGRGIGLIDARQFIKLINFIQLLEEDKLLSFDTMKNLREWFKEFIKWMETSKNGKDEESAINNHGSWYEAELTTFALFIKDEEKVRSRKARFIEKIVNQITTEGNQPHEVKRKKAWHYFIFNLEAIFIGFRNICNIVEIEKDKEMQKVLNLLKISQKFLIEKNNKPETWINSEDTDFFNEELRVRKFYPILAEMILEKIDENENIEIIKKIAKMTELEVLFNTQNDYIVLFPLLKD